MTSLAISPTFLEALTRLSRSDQTRVRRKLGDILSNRGQQGLREHYFPEGTKDFLSFSAGTKVRLLAKEHQESLVLVYVDHHDAAYKWAKSHLVSTADRFFEVMPYSESTTTHSPYGLGVARYLLSSGLPPSFIDRIRSVDSEDALLEAIVDVTPWIQDVVMNAATVAVHSAVRASVHYAVAPISIPSHECAEQTSDIERLKTQVEPSRLAVLPGEEDVCAALERPDETWRLFLHPSQQEVVRKDYTDKIAVVGVAGTGKTAALVHRVVNISRQGGKVLLLAKSRPESAQLLRMVETLGRSSGSVDVGYPALASTTRQSAIRVESCHACRSSGLPPFAVILVDRIASHEAMYCYDHIAVDRVLDQGDSVQKWVSRLIRIPDVGVSVTADQVSASSEYLGELSRNGCLELIPMRYTVAGRSVLELADRKVKPPFEVVWNRVVALQGEMFSTKTGLPFTYAIVGDLLVPSRTQYQIGRNDVEKAYELVPFGGPAAISRLVRGPSYLWAILHDERLLAPG